MIRKASLLPRLLVLLSVLCCQSAMAQYLAPRMSIHVSNPLSLMSKAGMMLQYRISQENSVLVGYRKYWGFFPGYQASLEFHRYFQSWETSEAFYYARAGIGNAGYTPKPYYSGWEQPYNSPNGYLFGGAGVGKRYNFNHLFIEVNVGLKFAQLLEKTTGYNENLFYSLGPGSFIDFTFHGGYQFYNEAKQLHIRHIRSHWPRRYK